MACTIGTDSIYSTNYDLGQYFIIALLIDAYFPTPKPCCSIFIITKLYSGSNTLKYYLICVQALIDYLIVRTTFSGHLEGSYKVINKALD
jgi:hypothetical protein